MYVPLLLFFKKPELTATTGENCVKRDHANLCSYNPKQNGAKPSSGSIGGTKRARSPESESSLRKEEDRWPRTTGKLPHLSSLDQTFFWSLNFGEVSALKSYNHVGMCLG
jgi:hypothetical protein